MDHAAEVIGGARQERAVQRPIDEHEVGDPQVVRLRGEDRERIARDESDPGTGGTEKPVGLFQGEARPVACGAVFERIDPRIRNLTDRKVLAGHLDQAGGTLPGAHADFDDPPDAPPVDRLIDRAIRGWVGEMEKIEQPKAVSDGQRRPP